MPRDGDAEFILRIQGRIDGLLVSAQEVLLEEIKTVQGGWDRTADPLHWAQAKFYGFIYAQANALERVTILLTYLDLDTGEVTEFRDGFSLAELSASSRRQRPSIWTGFGRNTSGAGSGTSPSARSASRSPRYRPGQRELAVAAYRVLARGGRLFLEAPTGIGKTISVLFPAVKALGEGKLERIFYLTARTVGRAVAEKALADLRRAGLRLRTLTLTAKEKICVRKASPATRQPVRWRAATTTAARPRCARPWRAKRSPGRCSKPSPASTRFVPSSFRWTCRPGWTSSCVTTTTCSTPRSICAAISPKSRAITPSSWTKRTTWWTAPGRCSPPTSTRGEIRDVRRALKQAAPVAPGR